MAENPQGVLCVPRYPGHIGGGVEPSFKQGGGGGGGPSGPVALTTPYLYTFDNAVTGGDGIVGWRNTPITGWTLANAQIVSSPVDAYSYNPNRPCLYGDVSATNSISVTIDLPGIMDISGGFRFAWWFKGVTQYQANIGIGFFNGGDLGAAGVNGLRPYFTQVNGQVSKIYGYANGASLGVPYDLLSGTMSGAEWSFWYTEWNPVAGSLAGAVKRCNDNWHKLTVSLNPGWASALAAVFTTVDRVNLTIYKEVNIYCKDAYLLGFWLGKPTDAWPSYKIPAV